MGREYIFQVHAIIGLISLFMAGCFSLLALWSSRFFQSLSGFLYQGKELEPITDFSTFFAMDSQHSLFAFLFILSTALNFWRCEKIYRENASN